MDFALELFLLSYDAAVDKIAKSSQPGGQQSAMRAWLQYIDANPVSAPIYQAVFSDNTVVSWLNSVGPKEIYNLTKFAYSLQCFRDDTKITLVCLNLLLRKLDLRDLTSEVIRHDPNGAIYPAHTYIRDNFVLPTAKTFRRWVTNGTVDPRPRQVPASDRIVTINHNQPTIAAFESDVTTLETWLHQSNQFGETKRERRARAELSAARELLAQDEINISLIDRLLRPTLLFIKDKVAGSFIANIAIRAIEHWDQIMQWSTDLLSAL